jgi:hypothetical protein
MNRLKKLMVWIGRVWHCRGFGIQSPTDFRFVNDVVNEHWPYYAYSELGKDDGWLRKKLGRLYMRLANYAQPETIADMIGYADYLRAGCRNSSIVSHPATTHPQMILAAASPDTTRLLDFCDAKTMMVIENIEHNRTMWKDTINDDRVAIAFDLYYCGILFFDHKRAKQTYIVNF